MKILYKIYLNVLKLKIANQIKSNSLKMKMQNNF